MPESRKAEPATQPSLASPSAMSRADGVRRWLPLAVLVALMLLSYGMGWHRHLSFRTIGTHYDALRGFIDANLLTALAIYLALYISVVALSLPVAGVLTISGGLLFGWQIGAPVTIVGATVGATLIFLIARTSIGRQVNHPGGDRQWLDLLGGPEVGGIERGDHPAKAINDPDAVDCHRPLAVDGIEPQ